LDLSACVFQSPAFLRKPFLYC